MNEYFYKGFEKRAHEKEAFVPALLAAGKLGLRALSALGRPVMSVGRAMVKHPGVTLNTGFGASDVYQGAREGARWAERAGEGALQNLNRGRMPV